MEASTVRFDLPGSFSLSCADGPKIYNVNLRIQEDLSLPLSTYLIDEQVVSSKCTPPALEMLQFPRSLFSGLLGLLYLPV